MAGSSNSFRKHGTFVYEVGPTVADHGGTNQRAIKAMQDAGMTHAWIRIHGPSPYNASEKSVIKAFIADLKAAQIAVAAYGWCQGDNATANAKMAMKELLDFQLTDYVADIEHGVHGADWTTGEIKTFCKYVRPRISGSFGITTFPLIDWHEPHLMTTALPYVDMFNPQVYWHRYPDDSMIAQFRRPNGQPYSVKNAAEYAELCLDRWDKLMGSTPKDIVVTGQAYWGEGKPPMTQAESEDKLDQFLAGWSRFNRIIGLNWWHFGGNKAMKTRMYSAIVKAKLGLKTYKP